MNPIGFSHDSGMKIIRKTLTLFFSLLLFGWYFSPSVHAILTGPAVIDASQNLSAPLLSADAERLAAVRTAGDERLDTRKQSAIPIRLFGTVPVRTLQTPGTQRRVLVAGRAVGIVLHTDGVQIVGLTPVRTGSGIVSPAVEAGLLPGDTIRSIEGQRVTSADDFADLCKTPATLTLTVQRGNDIFSVTLTPALDEENIYRVGAWVRDSTSGIGTLSFVDPNTGRYAALGHGVSDVDTGALFTVGSGSIFAAAVTGVLRGSSGEAGELIGSFSTDSSEAVGTVTTNTPCGIAGSLYNSIGGGMFPIAEADEVRLGEAVLYSQVSGDTPKAYAVRVIRLGVRSSPETDGFMIEITDDALLSETSGIVQGMSGSPVVQNGKLIGVVTHVLLQNNRRGYCIYAELMADKLL